MSISHSNSCRSIPNVPNISLVALYGSKPPDLEALIRPLQNELSNAFPGKFESYSLEQIHATLLGCEGLTTEQGILSKWFCEKRDEVRYIDLAGFLSYVRQFDRFPLWVRIGGYDRTCNYGFTSRSQHPSERSFQFQGDLAILMGWPCREGQFSLDLDRFRREAQRFNLLHKYHDRSQTVDNEIYMKLGVFKKRPAQEEIQAIEQEMREILSTRSPLEISIDLDRLAFVRYQDPSLPPETTDLVPLQTATPAQIEQLYP